MSHLLDNSRACGDILKKANRVEKLKFAWIDTPLSCSHVLLYLCMIDIL